MFDSIKIGGVEPASMLERPGLISSIVFLKGCNFHCPFCHNPELVFGGKKIVDYPPEELFKTLENKKNWIDSVIFTGGEPSLYQELPQLIKAVKEKGFQTGIHTNGTNPAMLEELLKNNLIDYIALDVKNTPLKYPKTIGRKTFNLKPVLKSIEIMQEAPSRVETIFRTTVVPTLMDPKDIHALGEMIQGAPKASLQQFRPLKCLDKKFEKLDPYPKEILQKMAVELEKYVQQVEREFT